jgi:uncharacterized cupin superfamily protein
MSQATRPVISLSELSLEPFEQGTLYKGADASVAQQLGLKALGARYNEIPPGKSSCPFHNHHAEEELFIVLEGEGTYRFGTERYSFKAGDVLGGPTGGPDTAHQILNTGSVTLKYLGIANNADTEVCEYPDSGKFQVTSRSSTDRRLRHCGREGQNNLDYWDGEPGA